MEIDFTDDSNQEFFFDLSGNGNHVKKTDANDVDDVFVFNIAGQGVSWYPMNVLNNRPLE